MILEIIQTILGALTFRFIESSKKKVFQIIWLNFSNTFSFSIFKIEVTLLVHYEYIIIRMGRNNNVDVEDFCVSSVTVSMQVIVISFHPSLIKKQVLGVSDRP